MRNLCAEPLRNETHDLRCHQAARCRFT